MKTFLSDLEAHDFLNLSYRLPEVKVLLKYGELIVFKSREIKGVLYHVLQMEGRILNNFQKVSDSVKLWLHGQ